MTHKKNKTNKKHNTINAKKACTFLQTIGGKDEPNIDQISNF